MQTKVSDFRKEITHYQAALSSAVVQYNKVESDRAYATRKLRETLDFLQEHNSDATRNGDWFAEVKLTREKLLADEVVMKLPPAGVSRCFKFFMGQSVVWSKMPKESFLIVGIKRDEVYIEGDFSGVGHAIQCQWVPIDEVNPAT